MPDHTYRVTMPCPKSQGGKITIPIRAPRALRAAIAAVLKQRNIDWYERASEMTVLVEVQGPACVGADLVDHGEFKVCRVGDELRAWHPLQPGRLARRKLPFKAGHTDRLADIALRAAATRTKRYRRTRVKKG